MKNLLVLGLMLLSPLANAEVKLLGTFVPSLCSQSKTGGASIDLVAVESVCFGQFEGLNKNGVRVVLNEGTTRMYEVKLEAKLGTTMGINDTKFTGIRHKQKIKEEIRGVIRTIRGMTTSYGISLTTSSNLKFQGSLAPVAVTQSVK